MARVRGRNGGRKLLTGECVSGHFTCHGVNSLADWCPGVTHLVCEGGWEGSKGKRQWRRMDFHAGEVCFEKQD